MKKLFQNEIALYLIFGVATTLVYILVRFFMLSVGFGTTGAVNIAQIVAILFAFITNKVFVFTKSDKSKNVFVEFFQFVLGRMSGWVLDLLISYLCIEAGANFFISLFHLHALNYQKGIFSVKPFSSFIGSAELVNQFFWTLVIQVLIISLNYLISKFIVFKQGKTEE
ncbi:GtrA-like protein [Pilibacter termitis]|uniref:GtrA-like protein n=1 Tax=Pilibacter termitis TaxID=263852 RepID=A0A1T4QMY8_9ENTE|nr:GtrA family protein [Pilibacter termitis]SKA05056.1 GtrA-like protein [Pilibacter termitis]